MRTTVTTCVRAGKEWAAWASARGPFCGFPGAVLDPRAGLRGRLPLVEESALFDSVAILRVPRVGFEILGHFHSSVFPFWGGAFDYGSVRLKIF